MLSGIITDVANIALALSFIVALVFGIAQVRAAERDRRERLALEALRNFQSREFAELMYYITRTEMPKTRKELDARPKEEQVMFIQFAQQMESLGLMVAADAVDIELIDRTLGSLVSTAWEKYKPMFLDMRNKAPDPYLAEYFQWLAEKIDTHLHDHHREPFYKSGK